MFKFDFSKNRETVDNHEDSTKLSWFPATEISVSEEHIIQEFSNEDILTTTVDSINLKLVRPNKVVLKLKNNEHENIIKAESQHSDLLPAIYEGGLKIWECSYDLGQYLIFHEVPNGFENKRVLDLGCGAGILGIIALLKGAIVHFQDYNAEVIELLTIPNVVLNLQNRRSISEKAKFYAGDWAAFTEFSDKQNVHEDEKYDIILSSETIYNSSNHIKLYNVFKNRLKNNGVGYIAGKTFYFGVGGGMRQFENVVMEDKELDITHVWKSQEGLQREIIKLTRNQNLVKPVYKTIK